MKKLTVVPNFHERLWGWIYLVLQFFVLPILLPVCNILFQLQLNAAKLNFVMFAINFIAVTVIFHRFLLENGKIALRSCLSVILTAVGGFFVYTFFSNIVSSMIAALFPAFYNVNDSYISTILTDDFTLMLVGTVLLVPVAEEVLYRGLVFAGLYNRSRVLAYIVSTLAFATLHVVSYIGAYSPLHLLLCLIEYIPAGLCLAWVYARTDSIWTPVLIHMIVNTIAISAMR